MIDMEFFKEKSDSKINRILLEIIDALLQPIMKKYNKSNHKAQSEYKTSINYDTMKY